MVPSTKLYVPLESSQLVSKGAHSAGTKSVVGCMEVIFIIFRPTLHKLWNIEQFHLEDNLMKSILKESEAIS
jgi:hypothetical protein